MASWKMDQNANFPLPFPLSLSPLLIFAHCLSFENEKKNCIILNIKVFILYYF